MNNIKRLIHDIDRGKDLEKNLPLYQEIMGKTYKDYAAIELVMSAYLLVDSVAMLPSGTFSQQDEKLYERAMEQVEKLTSEKEEELPQVLQAFEEVRSQIKDKMEQYTFFTDRMIGYEYVLKRMKLRFTDEDGLVEQAQNTDEDLFLQRLCLFLADQDQSIVKERLKTLVELVPIHMTKHKMLEKIQETVSLYKGGDLSSLESFAYMIRSAAMLHPLKDVFDEKMKSLLAEMETTDFSLLDAEKYRELSGRLDDVTKEIVEITDYYYMLQEVVNTGYAFALNQRYSKETTELQKHCMAALARIVDGDLREEDLMVLEGKLEPCLEKSSYLEAVLFGIKDSCQEHLELLGMKETMADFVRIANLMSDSLFVELEEGVDETEVDDLLAKQMTAQLTEEISGKLTESKRPVKKAIMSALLGNLPFDFNSMSDVEQYVRTNLFGCQDVYERAMVIAELEQWMAEE